MHKRALAVILEANLICQRSRGFHRAIVKVVIPAEVGVVAQLHDYWRLRRSSIGNVHIVKRILACIASHFDAGRGRTPYRVDLKAALMCRVLIHYFIGVSLLQPKLRPAIVEYARVEAGIVYSRRTCAVCN
jgi:hypothetical protein